jgi:hypothetical protein
VAVTFFSIGFLVLALAFGAFTIDMFSRFTVFHALGAASASFCEAKGWAHGHHCYGH